MRFLLVFLPFCTLWGQESGAEFFEKKIRPVLATRCYGCHSSKLKSPMGELVLDTKAGLAKAVKGRLLPALHFADPQLQMPPTGKLPDTVIADFEAWVRNGAPDPRTDAAPATPAAPSNTSVETGRRWWAFQPVQPQPAPPVRQSNWARTKVDAFVLNKLEAARLTPSAEADPRTLLRRVTLNLTGIAPTYEEVEAYAAAPDYEALVERLLASPAYGERWGRYWLDVARYAEDNPTSEATNPPYPYAWRYRDWVIEAINRDVPYSQFVKLQLAADLMDNVNRQEWRALGYVGAAPTYHKDARLSRDVIETLASDDWDERVDAVSRGLLGLTVACARCHDHKFDPIPTKDYYSLASIFASTSAVQRPMLPVPAEKERRFLLLQQQLIHWDYLAKLLTGEPGTNPEKSKRTVERLTAQITAVKAELAAIQEPLLAQHLAKYTDRDRRTRDGLFPKEAPFMNAVYDAGLWVDGSDPDLTVMDFRPGTPRDLPIFQRGNVANPGPPAPRRFLTVLAKEDRPFTQGSGRLQFAERIFTDAAPLAARVMVNRVWGWHFGKPLVATPSDFGSQGDKPSHPELLDDLSARFIANGWSLKWLHREILLSAAYRQSSRPRPDADKADPTNKWIWRMNPRRLDIEAWRDSMLRITGTLSPAMYGPSEDLDAEGNYKRTIYARVSRGRLNTLLRLYDFSDPSQHSPGRELTTTPLQQLFVMNSAFLQKQAASLAALADADTPSARIRQLYKRAFSREPSPKELDLALSYLESSSLPQLAQALLATNELIYWP
ncbi:MAG: DUF1553 domain-containing protein [Bryobacterales bacterium]|nr:DUF1553 domain-containing protein [Bryobacterales bacterium]